MGKKPDQPKKRLDYFVNPDGFCMLETRDRAEFTLKKCISCFFRTNSKASSLEVLQDQKWRPLCLDNTYGLFLCPGLYRIHAVNGLAGIYVTGCQVEADPGQRRIINLIESDHQPAEAD